MSARSMTMPIVVFVLLVVGLAQQYGGPPNNDGLLQNRACDAAGTHPGASCSHDQGTTDTHSGGAIHAFLQGRINVGQMAPVEENGGTYADTFVGLSSLLNDRAGKSSSPQILADMAQVARQLAVNATTGSHIDDAIREVIAAWEHYIDEVIEADVNMTVIDQQIWDDSSTKINKCNDDLLACESSSGVCYQEEADVADTRSNHASCRGDEAQLNVTYLQTKLDFENHVEYLYATKPACFESITFDTSQTFGDCLASLATWAVEANSSFVTHQTNTLAAQQAWDDKRAECNSNQAAFEQSFCTNFNGRFTTCETHSSCLSTEGTTRSALKAELETNWAYRNASYSAAAHVKCHIQALLANSSQMMELFQQCEDMVVDLSSLKIVFDEDPNPEPCPTPEPTNHPCTASWLSTEYESEAWYTDAYPQPCITCETPATPEPAAEPTPAPTYLWVVLYAKGTYGSIEPTEEEFDAQFQSGQLGIVKRLCASCSSTHQEIYVRVEHPETFSAYQEFLVTWTADDFTTAFNIFSTLEDALSGTNAWTYCNGNDPGIGFPRDCGPTGVVGSMWNSLTRGGQTDIAYYVYV